MARALSFYLRERVGEEVAKGTSCRQAAARFGGRNRGKRFGVSASSAIRWAAKAGSGAAPAPKKQGGDRWSQHLEAGAGFRLGAAAEQPGIALAELREKLKERGTAAGIATLWRCFRRHKMTRKKRWRMPPGRAGRMERRPGKPGLRGRSSLIRKSASSPARPEQRRRWRVVTAGRREASGAARPCRTAIGKRRLSPRGCASAGAPRQ
jgi:transposase